jgi:immune inhibitor A
VWTKINQVYASRDAQNGWAHLTGTGVWHRILTGASDGVTNVFVLLSAAKATDRQVYVVFDASKNITAAYL